MTILDMGALAWVCTFSVSLNLILAYFLLTQYKKGYADGVNYIDTLRLRRIEGTVTKPKEEKPEFRLEVKPEHILPLTRMHDLLCEYDAYEHGWWEARYNIWTFIRSNYVELDENTPYVYTFYANGTKMYIKEKVKELD